MLALNTRGEEGRERGRMMCNVVRIADSTYERCWAGRCGLVRLGGGIWWWRALIRGDIDEDGRMGSLE